MKRFIILLIVIVPFFISYNISAQITAQQILEKLEQNFDSKDGMIATVTMVIEGRRATRTLKSNIWSKEEQSFVHFLSPPREKDTKMLLLGDELWISSPTTDRIIKIAGHNLRQSMMGSDESYEDFMEDPELKGLYDSKISDEELLGDRTCYVLDIIAKEGSQVAYFARKLWVDKERFLALREDRFAKGGKLLKRVNIEEVFKVQDRWYPKRVHTKDMLMEGEGTRIIIDSIEFNVDIPRHIFTKANLKN